MMNMRKTLLLNSIRIRKCYNKSKCTSTNKKALQGKINHQNLIRWRLSESRGSAIFWETFGWFRSKVFVPFHPRCRNEPTAWAIFGRLPYYSFLFLLLHLVLKVLGLTPILFSCPPPCCLPPFPMTVCLWIT